MGLGSVTPLSLPTSEAAINVGTSMDMRAFTSGPIHPHHFDNFDVFAPQQSFAPSQFQNQPSHFESMDASGNASPMDDDVGMNADMHNASPMLAFDSSFGGEIAASAPQSADKYVLQPESPLFGFVADSVAHSFRFHVTLNAPTAMIKQADEIPVTYLNKGQAYSVSIVDTAPESSHSGPVKYRTFIRVSFEDEQQRQRPAACWQLWKEGRGTNEAYQRGGRLQAVECVDPTMSGDNENKRPKIELESASFDGFCVAWTATPGDPIETSVAVRFNFLSTDFSHSKGVKGIPVRLCAKTEVISNDLSGVSSSSELCYCKVKLFRDHGAERKLSNDVAHVKKTIDKLKQQIAQAETGMKDFRKKKRSSTSAIKSAASSKPGKVPKHKRTWSMSSASSAGGRSPAEEDLHQKLATMQDMFSSTRPTSILYLRGVEEDDPDLHPVYLSGEPFDLTKIEINEEMTDRLPSGPASQTTSQSNLVSPASSASGPGAGASATTTYQSSPQKSSEWGGFQPMVQADLQSNPQHLASPPDQAVKVSKQQSDNSTHPNWIDATGVDASYKPPNEKQARPVACVYVCSKDGASSSEQTCYRAVYLMQRTVKDLVTGIATKYKIQPARVLKVVHINAKGLNIMIDDDVVRQLPEGQDMVMELSEMKNVASSKREWSSGSTDTQTDDEVEMAAGSDTPKLEMRLIF